MKRVRIQTYLLDKKALVDLCLKNLTCERLTTYRFETVRSLFERDANLDSVQEKIDCWLQSLQGFFCPLREGQTWTGNLLNMQFNNIAKGRPNAE